MQGTVWILLILCISLGIHAQFTCSSTAQQFFSGLINGTGPAADVFGEHVTFTISGQAPYCPYCVSLSGRVAVAKALQHMFAHDDAGYTRYSMPVVSLRQLYTNSQSPNGGPRLLSFNDESFRLDPAFGGRYYRFGTLQDLQFNPTTCLISHLQIYHDPYIASLAFAGYPPIEAPVMPGISLTPPAATFTPSAQSSAVLNYQYIPGEESVTNEEAWTLINTYYQQLSSGFVSGVSANFVDNDVSLPTGQGAVLIPGDSRIIPYAGLYLSAAQIEQYHTVFVTTTSETTPYGFSSSNVTMGGSVAMFYQPTGNPNVNANPYSMNACDYFQIVKSGGVPKIMRLTRFFDTWNVSMALSNGFPFLQYRDEAATSVVIMVPLIQSLIAICCANFAIVIVAIYCMRK